MNNKVFFLVTSTFTFFAFSCSGVAEREKSIQGEVIGKTATVASLQRPDTVHLSYRKRSCCVGAPSRFRSNVAVAKKNEK